MKSSTSRVFILNTIAFLVVMGLGLLYLAFNVYQVHPGRSMTTLSMQLNNTNMILPGTGVSLNGLAIGSVQSVEPNQDGAKVTIKYPRSQHIPRSSDVVIGQQSALGEPYVDFQPSQSTGPFLQSGDTVSTASIEQGDSIPRTFSTIKGLTDVISAGPMSGLLKTLSQALDGSDTDFTRLIVGTNKISSLVKSRSGQLEQMFSNTQRYSQQFGPLVQNFPAFSQALAQTVYNLRGGAEGMAAVTNNGGEKYIRDAIHPFLARANPYLQDILPNVLDAGGPLLPIATAINDTLPQINASKILTDLLRMVGSDGAARLTITGPPR